jgi:hypothetical protein
MTKDGTVMTSSTQWLFWVPRILCILFALFLSLFALDVFGEGYDLWQTIVALAMHLIPTGLVLVALAVAWRWEWVGGVLFFLLGVLYVALAWGRFDWTTYLVIAGPLFLIGALFAVDWFWRWRFPVH